jgi:hypothetical protein
MSEQPTPKWIDATFRTGQDANPGFGTDPQNALGGSAGVQRRLLIREEAMWLLHLSDEQFQLLINTRQIAVIRIVGEERFDSHDLNQLIESYKATAARRPQ